MNDEFFLDPAAVRRNFDAASRSFDAHSVVHAEIRARLSERLDLVKLQPKVVVDLGAGTGAGSRMLQDKYRSAHIIAADSSLGMLTQAQRRQGWWRRFAVLACDADAL